MSGLARFLRLILSLEPRRATLGLGLLIVVSLAEAATLVVLGALVNLADLESGDGARPFAWADSLLGGSPGVATLLAALVAALLARSAISYAFGVVTARFSSSILHKLRMRLHRAASLASWEAVRGARRAELHHALTEAPGQLAYAAETALRLAVACAVVAVSGALALSVNAAMVGAVLVAAAVLAVPMLWLDRLLARASRDAYKRTARLHDHVGRYLDDLRLDRFVSAREAARGEGPEDGALAEVAARQAEGVRVLDVIERRSDFVHQAGGALALAAVIAFGARSDLSPAEAAVIVVLFLRLMPRLLAAHALLRQLVSASAAFAEHEAVVEALAGSPETRAPGPPLVVSAPEVRIEGLGHRYPGAEAKALSGVTLELPAGTATALLGLSGAGKTTLADIVSGLVPAQEGAVRVDGAALAPEDLSRWRACVAVASRDDVLLPDTIRANLSLGARPDEAAMWRALEIVGFEDHVRALPGGLDAEAGEKGARFSAGERQRLCLARAIAAGPRLLILDEATSAMNPIDEAAIAGRLAALRGEATILVIAHRLSSIGWVDRVAVLEEGRLAETGGRDDLLAGGFAARMAAAGGDGRA